jgi:ABC-type transport system substrate-binding protein
MTNPPEVAAAIASYLEAVGISVNLIEMDRPEHSQACQDRSIPICFSGTYDIPDPDFLMRLSLVESAYSGGEFNEYQSEMEDLALQAVRTLDMDKRCEYYKRMQEIEHEVITRVPIAHSNYLSAASTKLHNYVLGQDGFPYLHWAWLDK